MKRFGYWRDALCVGGCLLYALNRWIVTPRADSAFLSGHFNDLLLIPCALPLFLQVQRQLGWRNHDAPPRAVEILFHLLVWSVLFEVIGPHLMQTIGDPLDVAAYATGGLLAGIWWNRERLLTRRPGFDSLAPFYRIMEFVLAGGKLHRCRLACLEEARTAKHILLVGEGHGRFLEVCARKFPEATLTCVDASRAMLRIAEQRWRAAGGKAESVEFIHAELPTWQPPAKRYDLIVTHFFLDCFPGEQLARIVESLSNAAAPGARWLVADFAVPERGWRRWRARLILSLAYAFFRRATALKARRVTAPDPFLAHAGFRLATRRTMEWGLLQADLWVR